MYFYHPTYVSFYMLLQYHFFADWMRYPAHFQELSVLWARPNRYRVRIRLVSPSGRWTVRRRFVQVRIAIAILYRTRAIKANRWIKSVPIRSIRITDEHKRLSNTRKLGDLTCYITFSAYRCKEKGICVSHRIQKSRRHIFGLVIR